MPSSAEVDSMVVRLTGDGSSFQQMMAAASATVAATTAHIGQATASIQSHSAALTGFAASAKNALVPLLGVSLSVASAFKGVQLAASEEENVTVFGTLLKSVTKGKQLVEDLQKFADVTPLGTDTLQAAAKMLLGSKVQLEDIIPTLKSLGDVAGGKSNELLSITRQYSQVMSRHQLMAGETNIFAEQTGFNPLNEMDAFFKKADGFHRDLQEKGKVSDKMLAASFKRAGGPGGDYENQMEKASTLTGGLFSTLGDTVNAVLREVGKNIIEAFDLKGLMKGVTDTFTNFKNVISTIPAEFFKVAAAVTVAVVAVGALIAAGIVLKIVIMAAWSAVTLGNALIVFGVMAAVAAIAGLVVSVGGIGGAFAAVTTTLMTVWDGLKTVRQAIADLFRTAYDVGESNLLRLQDFALRTWANITGGAQVDWAAIKGYALDAVLAIEFGLLNFQNVSKTAWVGVRLGATVFANEVVHLFTAVLPAALTYFLERWEGTFKTAHAINLDFLDVIAENTTGAFTHRIAWDSLWSGYKTAMREQIDLTVKAFRALPDLISGAVNVGAIFGDDAAGLLDKKIQPALREMRKHVLAPAAGFVAPERVVGVNEAELRKEFQELGTKVGEDFAVFRARRIAEIDATLANQEWEGWGSGDTPTAPPPPPQTQSGKDAKAMDAVLTASAEGQQRIYDSQQAIKDRLAGVQGQGAKGIPAVATNTAEAAARIAKSNELLKENNALTRQMADGLKSLGGLGAANIGG